MTNPSDLQQKIELLESQRHLLGDAAVDAAIAALTKQDVTTGDQNNAQQSQGFINRATGAVHQNYSNIAPLFTSEATGNYFAEVINLYGQSQAQPAQYGTAMRQYLEHLYTRHAKIDLRGIDDRPMDMPLSELYVSLSLHEPPPEDTRGRGGLRGFMEKAR